MDHTHIVRAGNLERYADTRESEGVIPELVYLLVTQSVPDATACRIPYGDAVNQPGLDGIVKTSSAFLEFVPDGVSYWEIGTGADPQKKATTDFRTRTKNTSSADRASSTFVFVTPRSAGTGGWNESKQSVWLARRKNCGWKQIRIIDGVKLADWLREFPALGHWMANKVGITPRLSGILTPREHWETIIAQNASDGLSLPPTLFTTARENACTAVRALFEGKSQKLFLFAESPHDVDDFVTAFLAALDERTARSFTNRCLLIKNEDAWRAVTEARKSHVLVANPSLGLDYEKADLQTVATKKGHAIVVPLCGAWSENNPNFIKLRSPSQLQIEALLRKEGFPERRAKELAQIGGDRICALRRHLLGLGTLPPYATWENARILAQAGLVGKWDGNNLSDLAVLEELLGKEYGEWIEELRPNAIRSDSPLIQYNEKWRFVTRGEAWSALGNRVTDDDLNRLQSVAVKVLGESDPQFEFPKEERFAAAIVGKHLEYSQQLREGLAETLALVGSRPDSLSSCSQGKAENTAILTVRELLSNATWNRWASLGRIFYLLAEAAHSEFLNCVESAHQDLNNTPFRDVFAQESGGIGGSNYISGLLWALESLAWNPDFLTRVAVVLADLASIDSGGNWANRPSNSLLDIFLPWHAQTTATVKQRTATVDTVLNEHPDVGWKFLLGLLPHDHGFTTGCNQPIWRNYIPQDWDVEVTTSDYVEQLKVYTSRAIDFAKTSTGKLIELLDRLPDLPKKAHEILLTHISNPTVISLQEADRYKIWEKLNSIVLRHSKHARAKWALPDEAIVRISEAADALAPTVASLTGRHLFSNRDFDLLDGKGSFQEQEKRLYLARQDAVKEILDSGNLQEVLEFSRNVSAPAEVGRALGAIAPITVENAILPCLLDSKHDSEESVVFGFASARFTTKKWSWADDVLSRSWSNSQKSKFLTFLPFDEQVWIRVSRVLGEKNEVHYWKNAYVNPFGPDHDLTVPITKLIQYGRPAAACRCVYRSAVSECGFDEELATKSLIAFLDAGSTSEHVDQYEIVKIITRLQDIRCTDLDALYKIEWNFLPWLNQASSGSPTTLVNRLAADPEFFGTVIALVFRSENKKTHDNEQNEQEKSLAENAYKLLTAWNRCPGGMIACTFDVPVFNEWLINAKRITEETGHGKVAQIQIGHALYYAPPDPGGLWIHRAVASALNARDASRMRSGYTTEVLNQRGVHAFTAGEEEKILAQLYRERADAVEDAGFSRFATAIHNVSESYKKMGERDHRSMQIEG